jgi:predicted secreted protein
MAKVSGEDVIVSINVADVLTPIACARSITFDINNELIETSITGNGNFRTYIPGALDWSGTIEGLVYIYKENNPYNGLGQLYDLIINGTPITINYYEVDVDGVTFLNKTGTAYIESINETSSFDNMVTFTANIKGTGQITITYGDV